MLVGFAVPAAEQSLSSNVASVTLIARLAPSAKITNVVTETDVRARPTAPDRIVLQAAPGEVAIVTIDFHTNTRATLIKASAEGTGATLDVAPVVTTCNWVHNGMIVREHKTVASLTACKPSEAQRALIRIGPRTEPVTLIFVIEPLAN